MSENRIERMPLSDFKRKAIDMLRLLAAALERTADKIADDDVESAREALKEVQVRMGVMAELGDMDPSQVDPDR